MPLTHIVKGRETGPSDAFIATPSGSGQPRSNYVAALAETFALFAKEGIAADYCLHSGDCHVDDARNQIVRQFMLSKAPVLVFIDDDVGWEPQDLARLIRHDRDVVAGIYPLKQDSPDFPVRVAPGTTLQAEPDGLVEVEGVPTGFLAIKRYVVEQLIEANKHKRFTGRGDRKDDPMLTIVFERTLTEGHRWSGDLNFCRQWRSLGSLGGKVYVDPEMTLSHEGTKTWTGRLGDFWRHQHGVEDPRLDVAIRRLENEPTPEAFIRLWMLWDNKDFSAGPTMLAVAYEMAKKATGPILECGSGLTTIVMGIGAKLSRQTVYALEHDLDWHSKMSAMVEKYELPVSLCYAPLRPREGGAWYERTSLPGRFDLMVCDGPPRRFGRQHLFEIMRSEIADAEWIVDDLNDPAQLEMVNSFAEPAGRDIYIIGNADGGHRQFGLSHPVSEAVSSAA